MNPQFKKGILEMFILKIIENEQPIYGYDIMRKISTIFTDMDKATIYSILRRLYKTGMLEVELLSSSEGPPRKYYKLTIVGKDTLMENTSQFKQIIDISESLGIC